MQIKVVVVLLVGLAVFTAMAGCSSVQSDNEVAFWVVAGTNRGEEFSRNSLAGYDEKGQQVSSTNIGNYYIDGITLDSKQRLWMGQAWNDHDSSNILKVWQNGKLVKEIHVGLRPEVGLVEFNGEMVAGCAETGFGFSLWAVDLDNFESREVALVDKGQRDFLLLTTTSANDEHLVVAAIHDDPTGLSESSHASIWWFDSNFTPLGSLYLGSNTAVWSIVPMDNGKFMLLNNSGFVEDQPDLLIFDPVSGKITDGIKGSGHPFRGVSHHGKIYILDRIWSSTLINSKRSLTVVDEDSVKTTPLPDDLGAVDITVKDNKVYLAVWERGKNKSDGVYLVDQETGSVEQIIRHLDASTVLAIPD